MGMFDFLSGSQSPNGVLAPQTAPNPAPKWATGLGMFGAALQDAGNGFSGKGETDHLQQFAHQLRSQQLLQALTSQDPSVRQQAYAIAPAMGIDPKPFQAAQAAKGNQGLLSAMQPTQLTVPAAQANLGSIGGTPLNINLPASPTGTTVPGASLSDALAQSNNPELQAQYAPEMIKSQVAIDQKNAEPYDLAPGTTRYQGANPIVTAPIKPNPNQPFNADGTPNMAFQNYQGTIARVRAQARASENAAYRAPPKAGKVAAPGGYVNPASLFGSH